MTSALIPLVIMPSILLLSLLCGFFTLTIAQFPGTGGGFNGKEVTNFVDPFLEERCRDKGVSYQNAQTQAATCIVQAVGSGGGGASMANVCGIQDAKARCTKDFIDKLKRCYDDDSKRKELDMALNSQKASMDYMCEDNGRRFKELMGDADALKCMGNIGNQEKLSDMLECVQEETKNAQNTMTLDTESMCKATIKMTNCMAHMFSGCESDKPYDFFFGSMEAGLRASPCEPYVDAYLGSAGSISVNLGLLAFISMLYMYLF